MRPLVPGDRVEVYLQQPHGRPPWVLWRGVLVANMGSELAILGDRLWDKSNQPISFRPDQVRREFHGANDHAYSNAAHQIEVLQAELAKPVRWWQIKLTRVERMNIETQIRMLSMALHTHTLLADVSRQTRPVEENVGHEIITETEDGLKKGDAVRIKIPERSGGPTVVDGKFVADFRGWRFFTYTHGGVHAYPISEVTPKKKKQKVVDLPPFVVRDLKTME